MSGTGGFQTSINTLQAPAVPGDFASANPRATVLAGPGGLIAGPGGLVVGRFCFRDSSDLRKVTNAYLGGAAQVAGFVAREQQGLNTTYLSNASNSIPAGFGATVFKEGEFWAQNDGSAEATPGMNVYANFADGKATAGTAATKSGALTGSIAASTFSVTGSIADNLMTVTAVGSGTIVAGATISGTNVASGSKVVRQVSGTAGGIGVYEVSIAEQTAASTTISGTYGTMTVTAAPSGALAVGMTLTDGSGGAVVGSRITQLLTGTGGTGTYVLDNNTAVTSQTDIQFAMNVLTKWYVDSFALAGEPMKITSWPNG